MENKKLKCDKCNKKVKASNVFNDDRFYCRECGRSLGIRNLKKEQEE